jgi:Domain of unknown function (DUF4331)
MSDHFSGPRAIAGPAGDICDLYAFPSPERPDHLMLMMTVLPLAGPDAVFSDAIACRLRLRPQAIEAGASATAWSERPRRRPTSSHTSGRPIRCGRMNCRSSISPAA